MKPLSPEEEKKCVDALHLLGIRKADHPILKHRGYFALYLTGLRPNEVSNSGGAHPSAKEFREIQRLLVRAGLDRLKELLVDARDSGEAEKILPVADDAKAPHLLNARAPQSRFSGTKGIEAVKPTLEAQQRRKSLIHPESHLKVLEAARAHMQKAHYHDAYSVCADYLAGHSLRNSVLEMAVTVISLSSQYDRDASKPPFNMLFECEELAHLLAKHIPDMTALSDHADEHTSMMFRWVRMVYAAWTGNACALVEYRYKVSNDQFMKRHWLEPRDMGFLLDIMRVGVRSKLPLDLLRYIYHDIRDCIGIAQQVVQFEDKQARFMGDCLRIVASPVKDVVPDLQMDIYRDIARAYVEAADTATASLFINQGLLIHKNDRELLELREQVKQLIAHGKKA